MWWPIRRRPYADARLDNSAQDIECVDEVVAFPPEKLKFGRRALRVQRCKATTGPKDPAKPTKITQQSHTKDPKPSTPTSLTTSTAKPKREKATFATPTKGDPALGAKLSGLPKDARKEAKANDAERVARRLAKKKLRMAMDKGKGGGKVVGASKSVPKGGILGKMPKSTKVKGKRKVPKKAKK